MSKWKANKADAVTFNTEPTMTDQSQAALTDINVIVTQFMKTGQVPTQRNPIYGDFSQLPEDMRGFIEMGRSINELQSQLPEQLRGISAQELVGMTNEQINEILKPKEQPKEEPK
ncbi:MAG: internal scaffolding protein [Arizlama microvirus]|nr:MAG: internal scaffolding protein [Arizlama microvirus]